MKNYLLLALSVILIFTLLGCTSNVSQVKTISKETMTTADAEETAVHEFISYVLVLDYETQNVIKRIEATKGSDAYTLLDLVNTSFPTEDVITTTPSYTVSYVDNSGVKQDCWLNVYIENDKIYIRFIPEKMSVAEDLDITDELQITDVSVKDFLDIVK